MTSLPGGFTVKFEYGYGFDGGRRWSKDIAGNAWTWYPCGVACCAGELNEMSSDLTGTTWTVTGASLTNSGCGSSLIRSGAQYVHNSLTGSVALTTGSAATVSATAVFDVFGVQRAGTGSFASGVVRKIYRSGNEDGLSSFFQQRQQTPTKPVVKPKPIIGPPHYIYPEWPRFDGRPHPKYWGYGNWCGQGRTGGPNGDADDMNQLDACCHAHDTCAKGAVVGLQTQLCDELLLTCVVAANCYGDLTCIKVQKLILTFAVTMASGQGIII